MKTLSPFVHGMLHGASLTADISGKRYNIPYIKAVASRYSVNEKYTRDYLHGEKAGMYGSVLLAIVALTLMGISALVWNAELIAVLIVLAWQGAVVGNAFYMMKYEKEFINKNV